MKTLHEVVAVIAWGLLCAAVLAAGVFVACSHSGDDGGPYYAYPKLVGYSTSVTEHEVVTSVWGPQLCVLIEGPFNARDAGETPWVNRRYVIFDGRSYRLAVRP